MNYRIWLVDKMKLIEKLITIASNMKLDIVTVLQDIREEYYFLCEYNNDDESLFVDFFYKVNAVFSNFEIAYIRYNYDMEYYNKCKLYCIIIAGNGGSDSLDLSLSLFNLYKAYFSKIGCLITYDKAKLQIEISNANIFCKMLIVDNFVYKVIRISPFCNKKQTSFIKVHFYEVCKVNVQPNFKDSEIIVSVSKSSGAGGQHVNKTESKVKIYHKSSGISVICSSTRSQIKNRELALARLKEKINELMRIKNAADKQENYIRLFKISWACFQRIINLHKENFIKDVYANIKFRIKDLNDIDIYKLHYSYFYFLILS